ncbi:hypothetical protein DFP72DRAFT_875091 [Ephemerocybe angulata]|uniref:Uncharacterized protein n=1 Tax=Ephemerocybe angulata TaxID=980116 RepID=A0A8H6MG69_9AGAR|nr:hypothetical protein DFP72DRAFT_875091 [Tulosesus angulatus]
MASITEEDNPGAYRTDIEYIVKNSPIDASYIHPVTGKRIFESIPVGDRVWITNVNSLRTSGSSDDKPTADSYNYHISSMKKVSVGKIVDFPGSDEVTFPHVYLARDNSQKQSYSPDIWNPGEYAYVALHYNGGLKYPAPGDYVEIRSEPMTRLGTGKLPKNLKGNTQSIYYKVCKVHTETIVEESHWSGRRRILAGNLTPVSG